MKTLPTSRTRFVAFCAVLCLLSLGTAAPAQDVDWRLDYAKARQEAQEKSRPLLIDCSTTDCFWCKQLEVRTFKDPAVATLLNERFIPLRLDAERNPDLMERLRIQNFPTLLFAGPDGHILGYQEGFVEAARFREQLQRTLAAVTTPDWMARDYEDAGKAISGKDFAKAVSLLKNVVEDGKDRPVQGKARQLLQDVEQQAGAHLAEVRWMAEKGQTAEATKAANDLAREYAGSQAAREAAQLAATLAGRAQTADLEQRKMRARDLLAQAREDYRTQQFLCCLDRCEALTMQFADLPEGSDASKLATEIKGNPDWAKQACDQMGDRIGVLYLALADNFIKKGQPQQAVYYLERVVQNYPNSRHAEAAQSRLSQIQGPPPRSVDFKK